MSIEQKIAKLLEESKKLQDLQEEPLFTQKADEGKSDKATAGAAAAEGNNLPSAASKENEDAAEAADGDTKAMENQTGNKPNGTQAPEGNHLKVDVKEDVEALINGEDLTEEFKTKAATIFEAAVVTRVKAEIARLEEEFDSKLAEQVEEIKEGIVEKVDGYLNYVVEQWMVDNELALESGMKSEILESFVSGMKDLFEQHYIDVPEETFDVVGDLQEQVESIKAKLDEQLASNVQLTKQINEMTRESTISEFCSDMADLDVEKFKGLAEELSFEDTESFKTKLQTIKENYFGKKSTVVESVVTDTPVVLSEEVKSVDPVMAGYLKALGRK